jgi:RND family efflux transporter MFP subunit
MTVFRFKGGLTRTTVARLAVGSTVCLAAVAWGVHSMPAMAKSTEDAVVAPSAALTVQLVTPSTQDWPQIVQASGPLAAWQEAVVGTETGSLRITELLVDVGSSVKRGQLMARLADEMLQADLSKQNAALDQARLNLAQAQANLQRTKAVTDSGALSGQKIEEYKIEEALKRAALASSEADQKSTRIRLAQTRIVAVDDGVVLARSAMLGNVVPAGTELFRLVRQGRIEWHAELDAQQLARVQQGQAARLTLPGGVAASGTVRLVAPTLSTSTGRATVYVSLAPGSGAQVGMFASGTIELAQAPALTLPQSAVVLRDGRSDVYQMNPDGVTVSRRTVVTGRRQGDRVEVVSGLDSKARVVASGGAFLSEGSRVQVESSKSKTQAPVSLQKITPKNLLTGLRLNPATPLQGQA